MKTFYLKNKEIIDKCLFLTALVIFIYIFIKHILIYIMPFVVGYVISLLLSPLVDFLNKKFKIHRGVCTFILLIICILLIIVLGSTIVGKIRREVESFTSHAPYYIEQSKIIIANLRASLDELVQFIPDDYRIYYDEMFNQLTVTVTDFLGSIVKRGSVNIVSVIPGLIMNIILGLISAFFFTKDKVLIRNAISSALPDWLSNKFTVVKSGMFKALSGYIKAQLIIMSVIGSISILGLTIIGNPYAILIGLGISIIDALPIFGLGAVFWPWILISFFTGANKLAISLSILYGVGFLTRQFLEPKVVGEQIGMHPLLTLMSIYVGLQVFGVVGLILGPVILIIIKLTLSKSNNKV